MEDHIKEYFNLGLRHKDIVQILYGRHGHSISQRQVMRILHKNGLYRYKDRSDIMEVINFIIDQLGKSSSLHGYRWMHQKCKQMGILVNKEDVRVLLGILDSEGVAVRQRRRLKRRKYFARGPNYIWHMDSYDKLKPYGICINGCVDGYSRKVVWLNAYYTSSDPSVVGSYFLETVSSLKGCPRIVRGDMGTENVVTCDIQRFWRRYDNDEFAGERSFLYGRSTCNQRIESWWGVLRRECIEFWLILFSDMKANGYFDGSFTDKNLMLFCFLGIIQNEIDSVADTWNGHMIQPSRHVDVPHGRPDILYFTPELYQTTDYLCPIPLEEIDMCRNIVTSRNTISCDTEVYNWCISQMAEQAISIPADANGAVNLYMTLRQSIHMLL